MAQYFLSYAHRQRDWALRLAEDLERLFGTPEGNPRKVWIDKEGLRHGRTWTAEAMAAIRSAEKLIVVATPEAAASACVDQEWNSFKSVRENFLSTGVLQIVLLHDCELPAPLDQPLPFDFRGHTATTYPALVRRLAETLSGVTLTGEAALTGPGTTPSPLDPALRRDLIKAVASLLERKPDRGELCAVLGGGGRGFLEGHQSPSLAAQAALVLATGESDAEAGARALIDAVEKAFPDATDADRVRQVLALRLRLASSPLDGGLISAWRRHQVERHSRLVSFMQGMSREPIEKVYVEVSVIGGREEKPEASAKFEHGGSTTLEVLMKAEPGVPAPRWCVIGEPGAGKSTLARNLCRKCGAAPTGPIPVYVPLSRWSEGAEDPFLFAESELKRDGETSAKGLSERLRACAVAPNAVWVFFDGLDEVDGARLRRTAERIAKFAANWPQVSVCVLGRPVAFERRSLGENFCEARVDRLSPEDRRDLLRRYLDPARAADVWSQIERNPTLLELSGNPLLLTMLTVIAREDALRGKPLPKRRGDVYERAVGVILARGNCPDGREGPRDGSASADAGVADVHAAVEVLKPLSLRLHRRGGESWKEREVFNELVDLRNEDARVSRLIETTDRWRAANRNFLEDMNRNGGIFGALDVDPDDWRYLHRSFREYFAAEALSDLHRKGGDAALAEYLKPIERALADREDWRKKRESKDPQAKKAKDPLDEFSARWGEVWGLFAANRGNDSRILERVGELSGEILLRILPQTGGLDPDRGLDLLFGVPDFPFESLRRLAASWELPTVVSSAHLHRALERIAALPDAARRIEVASYIDYLLHEADGRLPDAEFFTRAGLSAPPSAEEEGEFAVIPAGTFQMGGRRYGFEGPVHSVSVPAFRFAKTTVPAADYERFHVGRRVSTDAGSLPVVRASWWAARLYCRWIGGRLPSEAEWEYACRAGTATEYWSGDKETELARVGWYEKNSKKRLQPVGEKPANAFGLFDMHGNVWEWCEDRWHDNYEGAPNDGRAWIEGPSGSRVLRGGSYFNSADCARSAYRSRRAASVRFGHVGFRPAKSVTP